MPFGWVFSYQMQLHSDKCG